MKSMAKQGDIIVCCNIKGLKQGEKYWTVGKEYVVQWRDGRYYVLLNDWGIDHKIFHSRFLKKDEVRNKAIDDILK